MSTVAGAGTISSKVHQYLSRARRLIIHNISRKRTLIEIRPWQDETLAGGLLMSDWHAELDKLLKETFTFIKTVEVIIEVPRVPPPPIFEPVTSHPIAKSGSSEREEIMKRVANFKAHQQRAIREREEYAASVLVRLKATQSVES